MTVPDEIDLRRQRTAQEKLINQLGHDTVSRGMVDMVLRQLRFRLARWDTTTILALGLQINSGAYYGRTMTPRLGLEERTRPTSYPGIVNVYLPGDEPHNAPEKEKDPRGTDPDRPRPE